MIIIKPMQLDHLWSVISRSCNHDITAIKAYTIKANIMNKNSDNNKEKNNEFRDKKNFRVSNTWSYVNFVKLTSIYWRKVKAINYLNFLYYFIYSIFYKLRISRIYKVCHNWKIVYRR